MARKKAKQQSPTAVEGDKNDKNNKNNENTKESNGNNNGSASNNNSTPNVREMRPRKTIDYTFESASRSIYASTEDLKRKRSEMNNNNNRNGSNKKEKLEETRPKLNRKTVESESDVVQRKNSNYHNNNLNGNRSMSKEETRNETSKKPIESESDNEILDDFLFVSSTSPQQNEKSKKSTRNSNEMRTPVAGKQPAPKRSPSRRTHPIKSNHNKNIELETWDEGEPLTSVTPSDAKSNKTLEDQDDLVDIGDKEVGVYDSPPVHIIQSLDKDWERKMGEVQELIETNLKKHLFDIDKRILLAENKSNEKKMLRTEEKRKLAQIQLEESNRKGELMKKENESLESRLKLAEKELKENKIEMKKLQAVVFSLQQSNKVHTEENENKKEENNKVSKTAKKTRASPIVQDEKAQKEQEKVNEKPEEKRMEAVQKMAEVSTVPVSLQSTPQQTETNTKAKKGRGEREMERLKSDVLDAKDTPRRVKPKTYNEDEHYRKILGSPAKKESDKTESTPKKGEKATKSKKKEADTPEKEKAGRVSAPTVGEIPYIEGKRVICGSKTGIIRGERVICDCCKQSYRPGGFEDHAGKGTCKKPYQTIFLVESGKNLDTYRVCSLCSTRKTTLWREGPMKGKRTLCQSCAENYHEKSISMEFFDRIEQSMNAKDCKEKDKPVGKTFEHLPNCKPAPRVRYLDFTTEMFEEHVVKNRTPLVIEGCGERFFTENRWTFNHLYNVAQDYKLSVRFMEMDEEDESQFSVVRDVNKTVKWMMEEGKKNDFTGDSDWDQNISKGGKPMVYAKDFSFGEVKQLGWKDELYDMLPDCLRPGNKDHDLIGYLPYELQPLVDMAYIGIGGTRTPLHTDKLASIAFNLNAFGEGYKRWWLINHNERKKLEEAVASQGGLLHKDSFWMAPKELEATGIDMWYVDQKKGDLVIVPPAVPHTVINEGSEFSVAVAANVMNIGAIKDSWKEEQENQLVKRSSYLRFKCIVHFTILGLMDDIKDQNNDIDPKLIGKLSALIPVYEEIIKKDKIALPPQSDAVMSQNADPMLEEHLMCDVCHQDIFNRYYHCGECEYDVCPECKNNLNLSHYHTLIMHQKVSYEILEGIVTKAREIIDKSK
eukprot:TRINITY_DN3877_c0_g1_i2.p1 TRINITY_DN3877_c0_g1~~TRINITY_DN3877_c0_g1_i2.p1  ORF type:complete len:1111 (-),score=318.81 TRINITY_DN3877_c0_g1_i2:11-3343(-)